MSVEVVKIPDIGGTEEVEVIEVLVSIGDEITHDTPLITLESEKATMDVPTSVQGVVKAIHVKVGDKVSEGSQVADVAVAASDADSIDQSTQGLSASVSSETETQPSVDESSKTVLSEVAVGPAAASAEIKSPTDIYASPAVRRLAREKEIDLTQVSGTGRKGRITKEDLQPVSTQSAAPAATMAIPAGPSVNFSQFGETESQPLSRINQFSAKNMHRNWLAAPHVTQFDEADITEMEAFRQANKKAAEKQGFKFTPLVFIMKAVVAALKAYPRFNSSLDSRGDKLIVKHYYHLGIAVDTPNGLVVPVIRDVDQKGLLTLAQELAEISQKAREGKLTARDMQGQTFTISSLGGIGGTAFTPIINLPDVAILGVSRSQMKPVYDDANFQPRLMLPLSLSYDHRVIDGALGARFASFLVQCLSDVRRLLL